MSGKHPRVADFDHIWGWNIELLSGHRLVFAPCTMAVEIESLNFCYEISVPIISIYRIIQTLSCFTRAKNVHREHFLQTEQTFCSRPNALTNNISAIVMIQAIYRFS